MRRAAGAFCLSCPPAYLAGASVAQYHCSGPLASCGRLWIRRLWRRNPRLRAGTFTAGRLTGSLKKASRAGGSFTVGRTGLAVPCASRAYPSLWAVPAARLALLLLTPLTWAAEIAEVRLGHGSCCGLAPATRAGGTLVPRPYRHCGHEVPIPFFNRRPHWARSASGTPASHNGSRAAELRGFGVRRFCGNSRRQTASVHRQERHRRSRRPRAELPRHCPPRFSFRRCDYSQLGASLVRSADPLRGTHWRDA